MKDAYEVLQQKESDLARVRHELESLRITASLLSDNLSSEELPRKRESSGEKTLDSRPEATGTDGLFSSNDNSRPTFWDSLTHRK